MIFFQDKIIYNFILLIIFLVFIKRINSYELTAFAEFLSVNYLKHGILVRDGHVTPTKVVFENYKKLLQNFQMEFFCVGVKNKNFRNLFYYKMPRAGIFVSFEEHNKVSLHDDVLMPASAAGFFNNTMAWFIIMDQREISNNIIETIQKDFESYNINIDADITVVLKTNENFNHNVNRQLLVLYDVYRVSTRAKTPILVRLKGYWTPTSGFVYLEEFHKNWIQRRRDYGGIKIRASTALLEKPTGLNDLEYLANAKDNMELDPMQRKTYQLMLSLENMFNMSFDISFMETWGTQNMNGSWTGVIGQLTNNEADLALCPLRFQLDRIQAIKFTSELHTQYIHFLFRHPRRNDIRNIFFEPLSTDVWWCVLALIIIAACVLMQHVKFEWRHTKAHDAVMPHHLEQSADFACFTILESIFQQGPAADIFHLISTRILVLVVCVFGFMLMQFYGAFIVGSLLSDTPRSIIDLRTLYASNLMLGMENVSYNYAIFTQTKNQLVKDTYAQRICRNRGEPNILSIKRGTERIKAGGFAFHAAIDRMYRILIDLLNEREFCDLQEIMYNPPYTSSSAVQKSSPLREHISFAILQLRATGIMQYNDKRWIVPKLDCSLIKANEVEVDLVHFAPALFALATFMLVSLLLLFLELLIARQRRHVSKLG